MVDVGVTNDDFNADRRFLGFIFFGFSLAALHIAHQPEFSWPLLGLLSDYGRLSREQIMRDRWNGYMDCAYRCRKRSRQFASHVGM